MPPPPRRTRRRTIAVAAITAGVVVAAALATFTAPSGPAAAPAPTGGSTSAPALAPSAAPSADPSTAAAALPADLGFTEVAGVTLPTSPSEGPGDTSGGLARGFAHTPTGAVLATVHLVVRTTPQVGPTVFDPTLRTQVVGPDAAAMRQKVARDYQSLVDRAQVAYGQPLGPLGRLYATLRGFRISGYSADEATVQILTAATDTAGRPVYTATVVRLRWAGGDWSLVAPPGGTWDSAVALLNASDVSGYRPFEPGR